MQLSIWKRSSIMVILTAMIVGLCWAGASEPAAPAVKVQADLLTTTALRLAPADCTYFSTSLRMKERILQLWNTKAIQKIWNTPLVKAGWSEVVSNWEQQSGPIQGMLEQKENQELLNLLMEMGSEECFMIGGPKLPKFMTSLGTAFSAAFVGTQLSRAFGEPMESPFEILREVLSALQDDLDNVVVPDFALGFKVSDPKVAKRQVARLAVVLNAAALAVPPLTGNVKSQKVGEDSLTTVTLDGAKIPWNQIPWELIEEDAGDFDELRDHLKTMKLTVYLGYYDGYILIGVGDSLRFLESFGKAKKLVDQPELAPLKQHLNKNVTAISYSSKRMNAGSGFTRADADDMVAQLNKILEDSSLEDDIRERLEKDFKELGNDAFKLMGHEPGAALSVSFQTDRGQESFLYQYSPAPSLDFSKQLGLLNHTGGDPLLAMVGRSIVHPEHWDILVKWIKKGDGYLRKFGFPMIEQMAGEDTVKKIEQVLDGFAPSLRKIDETMRTNLLPALADGQSGFIVDNKLVSTQWHRDMPSSPKPLPILEPALILGVSDRDKLVAATIDIRQAFNDMAKVVHELDPDEIPSIHWPAPESKKFDDMTLAWYSFPDELKLDGRLKPSAGLSKNLCTLTVSNEHAMRLMQAIPLKVEGGPLMDLNRPLASATYFHISGLMDTADAWTDFMFQESELKEHQAHAQDIRTIIQSLKMFRSYSSVTYREKEMAVTHSELHVKDVP